MEYNKITIVDENDTLVGYESYDTAVTQNLIRRAACVYIVDEAGNHLLQKRSAHVAMPFLLDKSVGGHVDEGETYHESALREMDEELGLSGIKINEIATSYRTSESFQAVYKATIPKATKIKFNTHEIVGVYWMSVAEIDAHIQLKPEDFTPNYREVWQGLRDTLIT